MNLIRILIILLFIPFSKYLTAQIPGEAIKDLTLEEEKGYIRLLCYSDLLQYSTYLTFESYKDLILNSEEIFNFDTLSSSGVKGVIFFKVNFKENSTIDKLYDSLEQRNNLVRSIQLFRGAKHFLYPSFTEHAYYFASSSNGLYKLGGFRLNEFRKFYADCFNTGDCIEDEWMKENRGNLSNKKIIKSWSVEEIDLWCMYKKYFKGKFCKDSCLNKSSRGF